jgi:hypothetical protein
MIISVKVVFEVQIFLYHTFLKATSGPFFCTIEHLCMWGQVLLLADLTQWQWIPNRFGDDDLR